MKVERFMGYHEEGDPNSIVMIVLKLAEKGLWQRFFLDLAIGFWEEWDEEGATEDFEGEPFIDLAGKYSLVGSVVTKIECKGSHEEFSSIEFKFGNVELDLRCKNQSDYESGSMLVQL